MKYKLFVHYNNNENYFSTVLCENAKLFINFYWELTSMHIVKIIEMSELCPKMNNIEKNPHIILIITPLRNMDLLIS